MNYKREEIRLAFKGSIILLIKLKNLQLLNSKDANNLHPNFIRKLNSLPLCQGLNPVCSES